MNLERYEIFAQRSLQHFEFYSEGPKGKIKKVIDFSLQYMDGFTCLNLSFGDRKRKVRQIDDLVITDNNDTQKVLATVAATVMFFTAQFPDMMVYAKGSTPARTRLYQMGIGAHWNEIRLLLEVNGLKNGRWQQFAKGINYDAFLVKRK